MTDLTYNFRQLALTPKKFGIGTYMANELKAELVDDMQAFFYNETLFRLTTQILTGNTVSEEQEVSTVVSAPATWFDHLAETINRRFRLSIPVKYTEKKLSVKVKFSRDTLYPGANVMLPPDTFGTPVMWETVDMEPDLAPDGQPWNLDAIQPSRFASRHELINAMYREQTRTYDPYQSPWATPDEVLAWLAARGVNPDQLVPRWAL